MDVISNGYKIPFLTQPEIYEEDNNKSARDNPEIVLEIVEDMIKKGIVELVDEKPHCVNPLGLVSREKNGVMKHRLVWDASRYLNNILDKQTVKLTHLEKALEITEEGDLQTVFDLKSAYYNIKIAEEQWKFLGARVKKKDGSTIYFRYKHLPFGLSSAVHAITKLWKPITAYLAIRGIRFSIYIDDGRFLSRTDIEARKNLEIVYGVIKQAGWILEEDKSDKIGEWNQVKEYLGFIVDTRTMQVYANKEKIRRIKELLEESIRVDALHVKALAQVLGKIISLQPAMGGAVKVCSRSSYKALVQEVEKNGWKKGSVSVDSEMRSELSFLLHNLDFFNGSKIQTNFHCIRLETILDNPVSKSDVISNFDPMTGAIVSDASDERVFAYDLCNNVHTVISIRFNAGEESLSSGHRELLAILKTLQTWNMNGDIKNQRLFWITDSENLVHFMKGGSRKPHVQRAVFEIFTLMRKMNLFIMPIHLRRTDPRLQLADNGSKYKDSDDWSIDECSFQEICSNWGVEFDLFASARNKRLSRFASLYYEVGTSGVDAFSMNWSRLGKLWICPPVKLLIQVARRVRMSKGIDCLILVPEWPTSSFYNYFMTPDFQLQKRIRPYVFQNDGARGTPLFGYTNFDFLLFHYKS